MLRGAKLADFLERYAILLKAGIGIPEALHDLALDTKEYEEELKQCSAAARKGITASSALYENGIIDDQVRLIVGAGEDSGSLEEVLFDYSKSEALRARQKREAISKLTPPLLYIIAALGVIYGLLVGVVPILALNTPSGATSSWVFATSAALVPFHEKFFIYVGLGLVGSISYLVYYATTPEGEQAIRKVLIKAPVIGKAIKLLEYSQWASINYVCIRAGISVRESWYMTTPMIAEPLRESLTSTIKEALNSSWDNALDSEKWTEEDERREWPIILTASLRDGGKTGDMVGALRRASDGVGEMGEKKMKVAMNIATVISMGFAFTVVGFAAITLIMAQVGSLEAIQNG